MLSSHTRVSTNSISPCVVAVSRCLALATVLLSGCLNPSAIIVGFDIDLHVASVGPAGPLWASRAEEISKTVRKPIELDPFGNTVYRGPMFESGFGASKGGFGVSLTNTGPHKICFRFDEARLSSNFQPVSVSLKSWPAPDLDEERRMGMARYAASRRAAGRQLLPATCLAPGEERTIYSYSDMKELFPNSMMFNVAHLQHVPELNPNGVGNWVKLHLPIEVAGRRENLEFTMTAKRSYARASYY